MLDGGEDSSCLLGQLLESYLDCGASPTDRLFSSRLRHLCNLLVDLDDAGHSSAPPAALKKTEMDNFSMWNKRLHTKGSKVWNGESSKISASESVTSVPVGADNVKKHSSVDADGDIYEHESQLPRMSACWTRVVKKTFSNYIQETLNTLGDDVVTRDCLRVADSITRKFDDLHQWTRELFGCRSQFGLAFGTGVWGALMALDLQSAVKFSYIFCLVIHQRAAVESWQDGGVDRVDAASLRGLSKRVVRLLQTMSQSDACNVFEPIYSSMLARRLLNWDQVSLEFEAQVCQDLQACFKDRRPLMMLQDMSFSRDHAEKFPLNWLENFDVNNADDSSGPWDDFAFIKSGGFRVTILRPNAWHLKPTRKGVVETMLSRTDERLSELVAEFECYFRWNRIENFQCTFVESGPSLHWSGEGVALVRDTLNNVELRVTTAQLLLLLYFNSGDESDLSEWREGFRTDEDKSLGALVERGVVVATDAGTYRVARVISSDLDCLPSDANDVTSLWNCGKTLERHQERRNAVIDCAIVRILKKKQECLGNVLLESVMKYCYDPEGSEFAPDNGKNHKPFVPLAKDVRARCDHLANTGYILHNDYTPQMLMYNPEPPNEQPTDDNNPGTLESTEAGPGVTSSSCINGAAEVVKYLTSPNLKDAVIPLQATEVRINSSLPPSQVEPARNKRLLETFASSTPIIANLASLNVATPASPSHTPAMTTPSTSTLTVDEVISEAGMLIDRVASVLAVDSDTAESLLLQYDWNTDKLIESFMVDSTKALSSIGITSNPRRDSNASNSSEGPSCPVCLNVLTAAESITPPCFHVCCKSCWKTYLKMQLDQDNATSTTCPVSDCKVRATTSLFKQVFGDEEASLRKHRVALARSFVQAHRDMSWCHNPKGCDRVLRKHCDRYDGGWCSACGWQTCFHCAYVEAHYPASCSHMSQWIDDGGFYEGMNEDAQSKHLARLIAKRCPNCQANIEKNDGCLHMKCTKCSHDFCWRCLQPWRPSHRDYYNCSSKVSKLAHAGQKFVEYNKRCQYHNRAKQLAYSVRDRLMAIDEPSVPLEHFRFALDLCLKLAHCRKVLAYCNVFNYYSIDLEKMNAIELHSSALENKTLELQASLSELLLGRADIQHTVAALTPADVRKGRSLMAECNAMLENVLAFSKDDMKVSEPRKAGDVSLTDAGTLVQAGSDGCVFNSRPAGMSDDESGDQSDSDDDNDDDDDDDSSDPMMSMYSTSDNDDDEEDGDGDSVDTEPHAHSMLFDYDDMSEFSS